MPTTHTTPHHANHTHNTTACQLHTHTTQHASGILPCCFRTRTIKNTEWRNRKTTFVSQMLHLFCVTLNTPPLSKDPISPSAKWVGWWMPSWPQPCLPGPLSRRQQTKPQLLPRSPLAVCIPGHCILTSHAEVNLVGIWIFPEVGGELKDQNRGSLRNLGKD